MPAEIIAHCGAHGIIPVTAVIAEICPLYGVKHIVCVICFESKAVAARRSEVMYGILKTACFTHYRYGSVAQGYHLGKAAGLAFAGHKQHIGAGVNPSCKRGYKTCGYAYSAGIPRAEGTEIVLILRFAAS